MTWLKNCLFVILIFSTKYSSFAQLNISYDSTFKTEVRIHNKKIYDPILQANYVLENGAKIDSTIFTDSIELGVDSKFAIYLSSDSFLNSVVINFSNLSYLDLRYCYFKNIFNLDADSLDLFLSENSRYESLLFSANNIPLRLSLNEDTISNFSLYNSNVGEINLYACKFIKTLAVNRCTFKDSAVISFYKCQFPDTLDFSFTTNIRNEIDLTKADFTSDKNHFDSKEEKFVKPYNVILNKADIDKFKLDYIHFKLFLPDSIFDDGDYFKVTTDDKEMIYEALLDNFKKRGQLESYKLLDIDYKEFKFGLHWYTLPLSWINRLWWNYGYNKGKVFMWALFFLLIFTLISFFILDYLNANVYKMENIPSSQNLKNKGEKLWYSFVYTSSVFFRLTLKIENLKFSNKWGTAYLIIVYTLGVVCLAYMANFVLQK